ncbi:hypothetical protein QYE76_012643 [Lolium multiflorum]|uniref:F-box domain-containing protein n=1 Tax=Lolium multiflorum TaxID=4521 RepID=A0AAD8TXI0_LOLMU|nr:hypothetical protein QYE76_012643 [Lolium multiflorum]
MSHRGNHASATSTIAATAAHLPGDILASILLRLPASDLRRFRRVCKEWRDIISDPIFVEAHQVQGPRAPTHNIVFVPSSLQSIGFLFDEQWRLTATFAAGETGNMVGTCNGLLCFLDVDQGAINVVEPFTGESRALPLPPKTARRHELDAYSFGFDPNTRRYKIIHQGESLPVCVGGAVYWCVIGMDGKWKFARLDLATEEVTTDFIQGSQHISLIESHGWAFLTAETWMGRLSALFVREGDCLVYKHIVQAVNLPLWRQPTELQALQRGHLLLQDSGGLYAHPIEPDGHDLGLGKLLLKMGNKEEEDEELDKNAATKTSCNTPGLFVPVLFNHESAAVVTRVTHNKGRARARAFSYVPSVSAAPLAYYFGHL